MIQRSLWSNKTFYLVFLIVGILHVLLLFSKYSPSSFETKMIVTKINLQQKIKIRLVKSPILLRDKNIGQIVYSEDPADFKIPIDSKYLSDKSRSFERQTRAKNSETFTLTTPGASQKRLSLSDLGAFKKNHNPFMSASKNNLQMVSEGQGENESIGKRSSTSDFLEGVPLGNITALNTVEYNYYGFYLRMKQKLEQFWGRSIQEKVEILAHAGRKIEMDHQLVTAIEITLDDLGEIIRIRVVDASGVKELDDAAIESFNEAGPFPNPPKGLIVNGKVIVQWGFVVNS